MALYSTLKITYNVQNGGSVDGVALKLDKDVDILGIDSVAPSSPSATFSLKGDGTRDLEIKNISKVPTQSLVLRLKTSATSFPRLVAGQNRWLREGSTLGSQYTF